MKNVFTFLLLLFSLLCNGQSPKLFTTDKELSSSLINQIYQDRNGFIWIATEDGLNRYDGAKFTIYKHEPNNEHSLAHNFVRTDGQYQLSAGAAKIAGVRFPIHLESVPDRFLPRELTIIL